jgi:peptidyl-tRNA hydrolase, PTH1 family
MKLIIGLGNSGPHYEGTRHNTGFRITELFAVLHNWEWTAKDKFRAHIAEGDLHGQKVILAKPTTYYNLSGQAVRAIKDFYKVDTSDILAVHDEIDLPFGVVRARIGGSSAGNNGIKNLIETIGDDFARLRVGVANDQLAATDAADFVLGQFNHQEKQQLGQIDKLALQLVESFIDETKKFEHTSARITEDQG